jgi:fumarylpyruvate hydrolase
MMHLPTLVAPTVGIAQSSARFPVRRIYCVGQNYADHAREMGSDPLRKPPFFFMKPADAVVPSGSHLRFPLKTAELHHEVELVVALGGGGVNLKPADAAALIFGWGVGIDLTRRDLQAQAKQAGRPWDMAKGFDASAPIGLLVNAAPPAAAAIHLSVNGMTRQAGNIADMIWAVAEIIATLSSYVTLAPGDLIFTGTPAGVGPVHPGDTLTGCIEGAPPIEVAFEPADDGGDRAID